MRVPARFTSIFIIIRVLWRWFVLLSDCSWILALFGLGINALQGHIEFMDVAVVKEIEKFLSSLSSSRPTWTWCVCTRESDQGQPISELLSQALPSMKKEYRSYPLGETANAIRYLEDGHVKGKVVISIEQKNNWHCFPKIMAQIDSILPCRLSMLFSPSFLAALF